MKRAEVVVAGAGIAGLACAAELLRLGIDDLLVLEAAPRAGGAIESRRVGPFLVERGPLTVRGTPELEELARGCGVELIQGRRAAPAMVCGGALLPLPPSPLALLRGRPLPLRAWLDVLREPLRPHPGGPRTVHEFVAQRFGERVAERVADLLTLGIYGAPARRVGFEAAFPALAAELAERGNLTRLLWARLRARNPAARRGLVSTADGLGALIAALAARLGARLEHGRALRTVRSVPEGCVLELADGTSVRARQLVLALPPNPLARVCESARDVARPAGRYRACPQILVSFALEDAALAQRLRSFGFLVPPHENLPFVGCLLPSAIFPARAPEGSLLLTAFAAPSLTGASDAELRAELGAHLERLLASAAKPELLDIARHPEGIWLYDRRHTARTRVLRARLRSAGIELAGAAYDGVAVGAAAASGIRAARSLAPHRAAA